MVPDSHRPRTVALNRGAGQPPPMSDEGAGLRANADAPGEAGAADEDDAYGGVLGAFPYAFSATRSRLCKSYVVLGGLVAALVTLLFAFALIVLIAASADATGGTFSFSRAFYVVVGLFVVAPLVAPVLFVARRHRRGRPDARFDAAQAALGYLFVGAVYLALVISTPADQQQSVSGPLGPVVDALYGLHWAAGLVPPLAVALGMWALVRRWD